jgi:FixJ family two-component response regulator
MPGMSGPDLQRELRLREDKTPIIFITGRADEAVRARVMQEGAADYLSKPFNDGELLKALGRALGCRKPQKFKFISRPAHLVFCTVSVGSAFSWQISFLSL